VIHGTRLHRLLAALVALGALAGCGKKTDPSPELKDGPAPQPTSDRVRLQGMWGVESIDDGRGVDRGGATTGRYTFAGDSLTVVSWGETRRFVLGLDEGQSPKVMTLTAVPDAGTKPKTVECLYKFEGETLVLAIGTGDNPPRPTDFTARAGGEVTFTAGKPAPESREPPAPGVLVVTLKKTDAPAPPAPQWQVIEPKPPKATKK
jgi:uncharacterized protein (TIGR03067 family)